MDRTAHKRANRIADKRAELQKLDDAALKQAAIDAGVKLEGDEVRDELEFAAAQAMIDREDADAAAAAVRKQEEDARAEREAFYRTPAGKKQRAQDELDVRDRAIRSVHASFIKALPNEARASGAFDVKPDAPEAGNYPVPNGRYRIAGSDWIVEFKDGKWAGASRAFSHTDPDWIEISDAPGSPVGAPAVKIHG